VECLAVSNTGWWAFVELIGTSNIPTAATKSQRVLPNLIRQIQA
jgi:hypothetical protein